MRSNRKIITAIVEDVYGDGKAAPTALEVSNVKPTLLNTSKIESPNIKAGFGHDKVALAGANVGLEFEMDLAGSGTAGTAPAFGECLRACGFSETIAAGTSTKYSPVSENQDSLSLYFYYDGDVHQIKGARGEVSINIRNLDRPTIKFNFTGIYVPVTSASLPSPSFAISAGVVPVSKSTTDVGHDLILSQFELTVGNTIAYRNLVNLEEVIITDRKSTLKLQIDRPNVSSKDWFSHAMQADTAELILTHGKTAGNIVEINLAKIQVTEIGDGEAEMVAQLDATARCLSPSGQGDDEYTFTFK
jgi:hypothetical protein